MNSDKNLAEIIEEAFGNSAKRLDLSGKRLASIPKEIEKLKELEVLDLSNNNLEGLPFEAGSLKNLKVLNLAGNNFSEFPAAAGSLVNLGELDFSDNNLNSLSSEIVKLEHLRKLILDNNNFFEFPEELCQLKGLEFLSFKGNKLTEILPEIINLKILKKAEFNKNNLTSLPIELFELESLENLNLSHNQLKSLPSEKNRLTSLKSLNLEHNFLKNFNINTEGLINLCELNMSDNKLAYLSADMGNLNKLTTLELSRNNLKTIPSEIGNLKNLEELNLNNNKLNALPSETGGLKNLLVLELGNNFIRELPGETGNLSLLQELDVRNNRLETIPSKIGNLKNLQILELRDNEIELLPPEIENLNLQTLNLSGNRLKIPPEIINNINKPEQIINYYLLHQYTEEEKIPLREAKVLIVGQGGVGKTSLVKRLVSDEYNPSESITRGINIKRWDIAVNDLKVRLNIWDFGGQEIMHATHQFFLTKRSLYILVLDSRQGEYESRIEYWLKIIQSFGGDSPIIVICNKCDEEEIDLDWKGLKDKYPTIKRFAKKISCATGDGVSELRDVIKKEIYKLDHIHDELLKSWFEVKRKLEEMEDDYISYDDYIKICRENNIVDNTSQRTLIDFLHDLGIILHFHDHPILEETNILNPEWVTRGVYQIINSDILFRNKGILERNDLNNILDKEEYPRNKHMFIINMMRKFELCFDFPEYPDTKFLIPDLLGKEEPHTGIWFKPFTFQIHYDVLPGSVISRFIVRMHEYILQQNYWRTGVLLISDYRNNEALIKADIEEKKIYIYIRGIQYSRRAFLQLIRSNFRIIHASIPGINAKEKVPVPDETDIVVDYEHLLILEEMGEKYFIPEGLKRKVNIKSLLDGVGDGGEEKEGIVKSERENPAYKNKENVLNKEKTSIYKNVSLIFLIIFIIIMLLEIVIFLALQVNPLIIVLPGFFLYFLSVILFFYFISLLKKKAIIEVVGDFFTFLIFGKEDIED